MNPCHNHSAFLRRGCSGKLLRKGGDKTITMAWADRCAAGSGYGND
jgi:hypothetical protein